VAPAPAPVSTAAPAYEATLDQGIQFEKPGYPTFIQSAKGMSKFEPTHRWTEGPVAVFTFAKPLPTSFVLRIDSMWAFGPNAGKPVTIRVGDWQGQAAFGAERSTVELKVKTATPATSIEFTIPAPTSPQQAGLGADPRMLGIALKRLSITPS
jgi:phosphoglycerol transferase